MTELTTDTILVRLQRLENPKLVGAESKRKPKTVPAIWWELVSLQDVAVPTLRQIWQPVHQLLPATMEEVETTLVGTAVLTETGENPSLLYLFRYESSGNLTFYRGYPPLTQADIPARWQAIWERLPEDFRQLYAVHNGWYALLSKSGGHLPIAEWSLLADEAWSLEKEIAAALPFAPDKILLVCRDGGGGYLGFALPDAGEAIPVAWRTQQASQLEQNILFFNKYDQTTSGNFAEFSLR
jgi:hypothetical protein